MTELDNLCPECGEPVKHAGIRWSGKKRKQSWACRSMHGCGRVTFTPVHTWQNSLFGAQACRSEQGHEPARKPDPAQQEPARNKPTKKQKP